MLIILCIWTQFGEGQGGSTSSEADGHCLHFSLPRLNPMEVGALGNPEHPWQITGLKPYYCLPRTQGRKDL